MAEHQPASAGAYFQYLHFLCYFYPFGLVLTWVYAPESRNDSKLFIVLYGCIAYYFSSKMVRLVILMGPIGSVLGSVTVTLWVEWGVKQVQLLMTDGLKDEDSSSALNNTDKKGNKGNKDKKGKQHLVALDMCKSYYRRAAYAKNLAIDVRRREDFGLKHFCCCLMKTFFTLLRLTGNISCLLAGHHIYKPLNLATSRSRPKHTSTLKN